MKAFVGGRIITSEGIIEDKILVAGEHIVGIYDAYDLSDCDVVKLQGQFIAPGFINVHIHGTNGSDIMDGEISAVENIASSLLKDGVTGFLATTMTMHPDKIHKAMAAVSDYKKTGHKGARVYGIHVEGPFINKAYKGAQNDKYIVAPEYQMIAPHSEEIRLITVAPEVEGMVPFIENVRSKHENIKFSIGHSAATYEEAMDGFEHGIESATHLFNGMTGLHHRKPGVVGAVLKHKPYFEVIADQVHLHPAIYDIVGDAVGIDKMLLITDAMCACQLEKGVYELGGQKVFVDEDSARLESGALAGSILRMNDAIRNVFEHTHYGLNEVVNMASRNPAMFLGLDRVGEIKSGYRSDLVVFDDQFNISMTLLNGEILFEKGN